jgi:hypothetical protein
MGVRMLLTVCLLGRRGVACLTPTAVRLRSRRGKILQPTSTMSILGYSVSKMHYLRGRPSLAMMGKERQFRIDRLRFWKCLLLDSLPWSPSVVGRFRSFYNSSSLPVLDFSITRSLT